MTEKLKEVLTKLKKAHHFYIHANEEQKERIFNSCNYLFDKMVEMGTEREFAETLVIGGEEFLKVEYDCLPMVIEDAERIFGAKAE